MKGQAQPDRKAEAVALGPSLPPFLSGSCCSEDALGKPSMG